MLIQRLDRLPDSIVELAEEARHEGFKFVDRLIQEFESGQNRFANEDEALFSVHQGENLIAVGGVTRNPLGDTSVGRIRRVFVAKACRGQGVGRDLIRTIEHWCSGRFDSLALYSDTESGMNFYDSLGYTRVCQNRVSHVKTL